MIRKFTFILIASLLLAINCFSQPQTIANSISGQLPSKQTDASSEPTGIAYYDAITINSLMTSKDYNSLYAFTGKIYGLKIISKHDLITAVGDNTYLLNEFNKIIDPADTVKSTEIKNGGKANLLLTQQGKQSALSNIPGLDVTNIANGIAEFMVKRAKQELTIAFFNRFQTFAKKHGEFQVLFPKTFDNLNTMLSYNYTEWLPALRTSFYADIQNIPSHIDGVLDVPECKIFLQNFPEIRVLIRTISLADTIKNGKLSVADGLKEFAAFPEIKNSDANSIEFKNFANSIKLIATFSQSVRNYDTPKPKVGWITLAQFGQLTSDMIKNPNTFNIFLGLIVKEVEKEKIKFYYTDGSKNFSDLMLKLSNPLYKFNKLLPDFLKIAKTVDSIKTDIETKKEKGIAITKDDSYNYVNSAINTIEFGFDIAKQFDSKVDIANYDTIARKANEVYRNIYRAEYPQAILNTVYILNKTTTLINNAKNTLNKTDKDISSKIKAVEKNTTDTTVQKDLAKNKADLLSNEQLIKSSPNADFSKLTQAISTYGLFIANMINAKTSDDVESLVESAVLPAGSSSIKKNSDFNFSVQSYLGAYMLTNSTPTSINSAWGDKFSVSAPIGLSISYGLKNWGAVSLFGSIFDIGAIVDYQLKKDSVVNSSGKNTAVTSKNYRVNLGQIVSPGAYFVYGFGWNLPLSLGFGYQYGPGLGKINSDGTTVVSNPHGRWGAFLSVDIPLITLSNAIKKK